jgi:hypothetical protein
MRGVSPYHLCESGWVVFSFHLSKPVEIRRDTSEKARGYSAMTMVG